MTVDARLGRRGTALAALGVVLVLALPFLGALRSPGAPMEEGKLLTAAELVLDGEVPHADFEHFYGPADVWAVASGFALLGPSVRVERLVGLGYVTILLASLFVLSRRAGRLPAALATIGGGFLLAPFGLHAYSWIAGVGFLLAATASGLTAIRPGVAPDRAVRWAGVAGAAGGVALLFRADLVLAVVGLLAVLWGHLDRRQRRAGLALGFLTGGLPYLAHMATAGPADMWRGMITDTLFRLREGRRLPVPPPRDALTAWLDLSAPEPTPSRVLPDPARVTQLNVFFWLTVGAIAVAAAVGLWALLRRRSHDHGPFLACVGVVSLGLAPQMVQRADVTHVRFVAMVVLPLACVAIAMAAHAIDPRLPRSAIAVETLVLLGLVLALAVPFYCVRLLSDDVRRGIGNVAVASVGRDGRTFPVADPLVPDATAVLELVDRVGPAHGRLFVGPQDLRLANYSDSFLYFVLGDRYRPASFYLESNPGIANADDSDLAEDLAEADVLILSKEYDNWDEPNASRRQGPVAPAEVVRDDFCRAGDTGRYAVWLRKGRCPAP